MYTKYVSSAKPEMLRVQSVSLLPITNAATTRIERVFCRPDNTTVRKPVAR